MTAISWRVRICNFQTLYIKSISIKPTYTLFHPPIYSRKDVREEPLPFENYISSQRTREE